tara:strand:- start:705 stop:1466 length:762 start_codon:yes stop_codon:yes gene_type:complete
MSISTENYIYSGSIRHRRFTPFHHSFNYPIFMVYFDIAKTEQMLKKSWIWNTNKPSLISFYRRDYHGDPKVSLDKSVRLTILDKAGVNIEGPIRLLTHLRYFGYCFNPVSFYYCFDKEDKNVELIMAEVTNTPWQERHCYFVTQKTNTLKNLKIEMAKEFHVSPFWGMDHNYEWIFSVPENKLTVHMINFLKQSKVFDATLYLNRKKLSLNNLIMNTLKFPLITMRIVFRIHWQAFKLWIKGATFFVHPSKGK